MKFVKIYETFQQNLYKCHLRYHSGEFKQTEKNLRNVRHTVNEYINIPKLYKYFANRFNAKDALKENMSRRNRMQDIDKLHGIFVNLNQLFEKKNELEYLKFENAKLISDIKTKSGTLMNFELDKIKNKGRQIKYQLKELMNGQGGYRASEKSLLPLFMQLPNELDPDTPDYHVTLHEDAPKDSTDHFSSHLNLQANNLLFCQQEVETNEFTLQMHYLENDLSKLEIKFVRWLHRFMKLNSSFQHIVCPDLVKRYIAGCCEDENEKLLYLDTNKEDPNHDLVLTGNSLSTYISYLTTYEGPICSSIKFYRIGSHYKNEPPNTVGLYKATQNLQLDIFTTSLSDQTSKLLFDESVNILKNLYASLQLPHKLVMVPAYDLQSFESKKVEAFLWSPAFKQYFKSGFVRSCGDIFSRSFELKCKRDYLFMNHGILIKVPPFLASIIEHNRSLSISTMEFNKKFGIDI